MKKFWTTQNGIIGYAHYNRHDRLVDFRPPTYIFFRFRYFPEEGQQKATWLLSAEDIESIYIFADRYEEKIEEKNDETITKRTYYGEFEGVPLTHTTTQITKVYDKNITNYTYKQKQWAINRCQTASVEEFYDAMTRQEKRQYLQLFVKKRMKIYYECKERIHQKALDEPHSNDFDPSIRVSTSAYFETIDEAIVSKLREEREQKKANYCNAE